jgi:putative serine protease PepD
MQYRPEHDPSEKQPDLGFGPRPSPWAMPRQTSSDAQPSPSPEPIAPPVVAVRPVPPSRMPSSLMRWAPAIAGIALLVLLVTAFQAWSLSRRLSDVDERLRLATNDVLDLEGRVIPIEHKSGQWLDAVRVARGASPAVFTIVAANGQGSGFGFYTDGDVTYIATNYHVVAGTAEAHQRVEVHQDGRRWFGITEIWDKNSDVALVRVNEDLPVLISAYGEGHDPALGDPVLAFGTPVGLEGSATQGIISALRRGVIQTDAQINPGNSGGPLLNRYGEVLGLTTAGIGAGSGLGFAVDIREVCALAGDHTC